LIHYNTIHVRASIKKSFISILQNSLNDIQNMCESIETSLNLNKEKLLNISWNIFLLLWMIYLSKIHQKKKLQGNHLFKKCIEKVT
jgi:hypothetical protein